MEIAPCAWSLDCRYTGVKCQRRVAVEELRPGDSCDVHSWIEGASGNGRRVSWFAPQNQGGGWRLKTPSRGGTSVGLGFWREVLAGFLKTGHLSGFRGRSKTADRYFIDVAASQQRLRVEERNYAVDRVCTAGCCRPNRSDQSPGPVWSQQLGIKTRHQPVAG